MRLVYEPKFCAILCNYFLPRPKGDKPVTCLHKSIIERFCSIFIFPFHYDGNRISPDPKFWSRQCFEIPRRENDLKDKWELKKNYAEYIYFHEYVSSFLFPYRKHQGRKKNERVTFYKFNLKKGAVALMEIKGGRKMAALINGIYMHVYPGNIAILAIETSNSSEQGFSIAEKESIRKLPLISTGSELLLFHQMFRRLYPAYFEEKNLREQIDNNEFPIEIKLQYLENDELIGILQSEKIVGTYLKEIQKEKAYPEFPNHITGLLKSFCKESSWFPVLDDRMLVYSYLAFPSEQKRCPKKKQEVFFSQLLYVDNPDTNFRYDPEFTKSLITEKCYRRWLHYGTRMAFSRYSGVFQYFGHREYLYRPFSSMYYQMFLLITYYRTRLIRFSEEVAEIARDWPYDDEQLSPLLKARLRKLHKDFMRFMNMHWFVEVTNQDQGIEIFKLMREAFELEPMYAQVKEEIERADELVGLLHNEKVERFNKYAGWIGIFLGLAAILTGFFGMNFEKIAETGGWGSLSWLFWIVLGFTILFTPPCVWLALKLFDKISRGRKNDNNS